MDDVDLWLRVGALLVPFATLLLGWLLGRGQERRRLESEKRREWSNGGHRAIADAHLLLDEWLTPGDLRRLPIPERTEHIDVAISKWHNDVKPRLRLLHVATLHDDQRVASAARDAEDAVQECLVLAFHVCRVLHALRGEAGSASDAPPTTWEVLARIEERERFVARYGITEEDVDALWDQLADSKRGAEEQLRTLGAVLRGARSGHA